MDINKTFIKGIEKAARDLIGNEVLAYADDIIIYGKLVEEVLDLLEKLFARLPKNGYVLSSKKRCFF